MTIYNLEKKNLYLGNLLRRKGSLAEGDAGNCNLDLPYNFETFWTVPRPKLYLEDWTYRWSPFWRWSTGHVRLSYRLAMTVWEWLWIVDEPNGSASFVVVPSFFPSRVWWVFPKSKQFQRSKTGWAENWLLLLSQLEELPLFSCIGEPPGILHENY